MRYRLTHIAEYALLRTIIAPVQLMPRRLALAWGWWHAALAFYGFRFRVAETMRRIESVFGERYSRREVRRIAWQSWLNMVFNAIELMRLRPGHANPRLPPVTMTSVQALIDAQKTSPKGSIFACPHMGNWELAGVLMPREGIPFMAVAAKLKNPLVNRYLTRLRTAGGIELVERGSGAVRQILPRLRAGSVLAVLPDVRSRHPGVKVNFLGGEANAYPGMGALAHKANVPIHLGIMRRDGWRGHRLEFLGTFDPDPSAPREADIQRLTQCVFDRLDTAIRETPGQWFWFNRRWLLDPL